MFDVVVITALDFPFPPNSYIIIWIDKLKRACTIDNLYNNDCDKLTRNGKH